MKIRRGSLLVLLLIAAISIIVIGCAQQVATGASSSSSSSSRYSDDITKGAWLYASYACVQCHGLGGRGRDLMSYSGPSLLSVEFKTAFPKKPEFDAALMQTIKNGAIIEGDHAASMPAWNGILSDEEIAQIVAYIRAGLPDMGVANPPATSGAEIYTAYACVKCHGALGTGGIKNQAASTPEHRVIPKLGGAEFRQKFGSPEMVRKVILQGRLVENGRAGVVYMPAWGRIGTAEQIERVVDYVWNFTGP